MRLREEVIEESSIVETLAEVGAKSQDTVKWPMNESCDRADVLEAISYILKQKKVRKEILTKDKT
jgi:hypothetical protein